MPLARMVKFIHSRGYKTCIGVQPAEKEQPNKMMEATSALAEAGVALAPSSPMAVKAQIMQRKMQRPAVPPNSILRRPTRSTNRQPMKAQTAEQTVFSALIRSW
jgi:hypothetical protein